jgi:hypothetical protein
MTLKARMLEITSKASGTRAIMEMGPPVCGRGDAVAVVYWSYCAVAAVGLALAEVEALAEAEALDD